MDQEIISFLKMALECSVLVEPLDPGLTFGELCEVAKRVGYQDGEINDAMLHTEADNSRNGKLIPSSRERMSWIFLSPEEPEYRNFQAFDFVFAELNALTRSAGAAKALVERRVLVERAMAKGFSRHDIEVATTWLVLSNQLTETDGILRFTSRQGVHGSPSDQLKAHRVKLRRPQRERAYPIVKDVVERPGDGRPPRAEPLDAFADELDKLGYRQFRLWWTQTVAELRVTDPSAGPVSASVLAAALVEGALTFIVKHARKSGHFHSTDYDREPQSWKIENLVRSAASGGPSAILDQQIKGRAETLIRSRQRIHAGRMLSDYPGGPPDIRPDEARDAKGTAEQVVRAILDWLQKNPA
jgi:hypothetical protein